MLFVVRIRTAAPATRGQPSLRSIPIHFPSKLTAGKVFKHCNLRHVSSSGRGKSNEGVAQASHRKKTPVRAFRSRWFASRFWRKMSACSCACEVRVRGKGLGAELQAQEALAHLVNEQDRVPLSRELQTFPDQANSLASGSRLHEEAMPRLTSRMFRSCVSSTCGRMPSSPALTTYSGRRRCSAIASAVKVCPCALPSAHEGSVAPKGSGAPFRCLADRGTPLRARSPCPRRHRS